MRRLFAALMTGLVVGVLFTGTAHAAEPDCKTVTADLVRPDSGTAGDWATDTFHRTVKVCHAPQVELKSVEVQSWTYTAVGDDSGTFKTKGVKSFTGATMKPDVTGTFTGHFSLTFEAPKDWGLWAGSAPGSQYSTSEWLAHLWSDGYKPGAFTWGWTYKTCDETLINASSGNHGDITGLSETPCYSVTFTDQCDGTTTVTLAADNPGGTATYVIGKKPYTVKPGEKVTVAVAPVKGYVVVEAKRHLPWKHKYVKPACATPSSSPVTPVDTGSGSLPVTGPAVPGVVIGGLALLTLGGAGIWFARRRRIRFTA